MRLTFCYAGMEFDFNLALPSVSFSFGPVGDDEPEPEFLPYQDAGSTGRWRLGSRRRRCRPGTTPAAFTRSTRTTTSKTAPADSV